jgi:hypothetical protein
MSAPRAEATPGRTPALSTDAQADLVRRYARMLRSASASAGMRRNGFERPAWSASSGRFTRPMVAEQRIDDA